MGNRAGTESRVGELATGRIAPKPPCLMPLRNAQRAGQRGIIEGSLRELARQGLCFAPVTCSRSSFRRSRCGSLSPLSASSPWRSSRVTTQASPILSNMRQSPFAMARRSVWQEHIGSTIVHVLDLAFGTPYTAVTPARWVVHAHGPYRSSEPSSNVTTRSPSNARSPGAHRPRGLDLGSLMMPPGSAGA